MIAQIIKANQQKNDLFPENKKYFSIEEISFILDGIVQPVFFSNVWFFYNPNGLKMQLSYNYEAARLLGFPVYGDCIFIEQSYLPSYFFITGLDRNDNGEVTEENDLDNELIDDMMDDDEEEMIDDESDLLELEKIDEQEQIANVKRTYDISFSTIFNNGYTYDELMKSKIITDSNGQLYKISSLTGYYKFLDNMYRFYIKNDEFDKCEKIVEFMNYTHKYIPKDRI